jgi:hypothetical protein
MENDRFWEIRLTFFFWNKGVDTEGRIISSPSELSCTSLPPRYTMLFGGNFMVLDVGLKSDADSSKETDPTLKESFLEVGFGDNRRGFAGLHRFEVSHDVEKETSEHAGITICYSSISCNPTVNKPLFPKFVFGFHKFYAMCLFRDGIAEVLKT